MGANKMSKNLISKLGKLTVFGVLLITASSCVKTRPAALPDGVADDIYEKSVSTSATVSVKAGDTPLLSNAVRTGGDSV
ncbi:hypothetical protein WDW86_00115, partial [Bdellovibrionota bacterium FG-2]